MSSEHRYRRKQPLLRQGYIYQVSDRLLVRNQVLSLQDTTTSPLHFHFLGILFSSISLINMKFLVLLGFVVVAYASPLPQFQAAGGPAAAAPAPGAVGAAVPAFTYVPSAQFHSQNEFGGYNYGYVSADGQGKNEFRGADGSVVGTYNYIDPSGKPVTVQYSAGPAGFQAAGLHIPQPVALPEANVRATQEHFAAKAIATAKANAAAAAAAQAAAAAPAAAQPAPAAGGQPAFVFFG